MVARGARAAPPSNSMDRLTSIHIPVRSSSRPRNASPAKPQATAQRHSASGTSPQRRNRYLSPPAGRPRNADRNRMTPRTFERKQLSEGRDSNTQGRQQEKPRYEIHHRMGGDDYQRDEPPSTVTENHRHEHQSESEGAYGEAICDYDNGATGLYELLESSNWEKARSRCRSHPGEVRTWIVRKDRSLQVRWKLLPLHAAIIFQSPNFIVSALLEKYPTAASRKDDQGMLPLHLAFRHKQEDEDLLELLLIQYPKAVMVKDRRERVPLEHGRDCKFSAKLMRLYADATVAGSRTLGSKHDSRNGSPIHTRETAAHSQEIARLEAEHEGKIAVIKAGLKAENDGKTADLRAEFDDEIQQLRHSHEERMVALMEENRKKVEEACHGSSHERQRLLEQHKEEMNELRDLLTSQVRKDRMMRDALENEVTGLHSDLAEAKQTARYEHSKYQRMKAHVKEVHELLSKVCEDQVHLQDLVAQQQEELESAQSVRQNLLHTLLENEAADGDNCRIRIGRMAEMTSNLKHKIERTLERNDDFSDSSITTGKDQLSRIERERESDEGEPYSSGQENQMKDDTAYQMEEVLDAEREGHYLEEEASGMSRDEDYGIDPPERGVISDDTYHQEKTHDITIDPYGGKEAIEITNGEDTEEVYPAQKQKERGFEGRILADDISAITDNTEF